MAYNPALIPAFATTVSLLAAYPAGVPVPPSVITEGRNAVNDGGGAQFYYDSGDTTTADNSGTIRVDAGGRRWKALVTSVSPELFGAFGDGASDCYAGLKALAAYISTGACTSVRCGFARTYLINQHIVSGNGISSIQWNNVNGLTIEGNGSTFQSAGGFNRAASTTSTVLPFYFTKCNDLTLKNFTCYGSSDTITKGGGVGASPDGYAIKLQGCVGIIIDNVNAKYWITDGILFDSASGSPQIACKNATVRNFLSTYNARQGISVVQLYGGLFENCDFSNTGKSSYGADAPSLGLDIEPGALTPTVDVDTGDLVFLECTFTQNFGGIWSTSSPTKVSGILFIRCHGVQNTADSDQSVIAIDAQNVHSKSCKWELGLGRILNGATPLVGQSATWEDNDISGSGADMFAVGQDMPCYVNNNNIRCTAAAPLVNQRIIQSTGRGLVFTNNRIFNPAAAYTPASGGDDSCVAVQLEFAKFIGNNTYDTDLNPASGAHGAAHYWTSYAAALQVQNDTFLGLSRGAGTGSFRPAPNVTFNTTFQFSIGLVTCEVLGFATTNSIWRVFKGTAAPGSGGPYYQGDYVMNTTIGSGNPRGWGCSVAGSPGTWIPDANWP